MWAGGARRGGGGGGRKAGATELELLESKSRLIENFITLFQKEQETRYVHITKTIRIEMSDASESPIRIAHGSSSASVYAHGPSDWLNQSATMS